MNRRQGSPRKRVVEGSAAEHLSLPTQAKTRNHRRLVAVRWRWAVHAVASHPDHQVHLGQFQTARFCLDRRKRRFPDGQEKVTTKFLVKMVPLLIETLCVLSMMQLLAKFRIPVSDVVLISDITLPPQTTTKTWFDNLTKNYVRHDNHGEAEGENPGSWFILLIQNSNDTDNSGSAPSSSD